MENVVFKNALRPVSESIFPKSSDIVAIVGLSSNTQYSNFALVGDHASLTGTFNGSAFDSQSWGSSQGGTQFGIGASPTDYTSADTNNPTAPGSLWFRGVKDSVNYDEQIFIRAAIATFSVQPTISGTLSVGQTLTLNKGTATGGVLIYTTLTLAGVDKLSEISGTSWDTTGESAGEILYQVTSTTSGGIDLSSVVSADLAEGDTTAPTLSGNSFVDATDTATFTTDEGGTLFWGSSLTSSSPTAAQLVAGTGGGILEAGNDNVASAGQTNFSATITATTGATGNSRKISYMIQDASGNNSNVITATFTVDITAPTLSSITTTAGNTSADLDWSTNEGNGTAFWSLTTVVESDVADIITGTLSLDFGNVTIVATGAQTQINVIELSNGVEVFFNIFHRDAHGNDSAVTSTAVTPIASSFTETVVTLDGSTYLTSANNMKSPDANEVLTFWSGTLTDVTSQVFWCVAGTNVGFTINAGDVLKYRDRNYGQLNSSGGEVTDGHRCHIAFHGEVVGANLEWKSYVWNTNDTTPAWNIAGSGTIATTSGPFDTTEARWRMLADYDATQVITTGSVVRMFTYAGTSVPDFSDSAVRLSFIDEGIIVDPAITNAAHGTPDWDMYGPAADWNTAANKGSVSETFTRTGTFT